MPLLKQDDRKGGVALGEAVGGHQTADPTTNDGYIILFRHGIRSLLSGVS